MVEDAIGLVILAIAAVILLMVAGFGILFSFDLLSSSVSWIGRGPEAGWLLLGALFGTLFGVVQGMRARGKSDDRRKVYIGAVAAGVLLFAAAAASPAGRVMLGW